MFGYIYKTVNNINNKIYIGRHKWDGHPEDTEAVLRSMGSSNYVEWLQSFKDSHGFELFPIDPNYIGSSPALLADVEKYGKDNFYIIDILDIADTPQELKKKETEWIQWYRSVGTPMYNVSSSGYWGSYKEELSGEALTKFIEDRRKGGDASKFGDCRGENNGNYGHHLSIASKQKMSRALKGRVQSEEERKKRSRAHNPNFNPPNQKGKRIMHLKDKWTFVSPEDVSDYLNAGWEFGQGRFCITDGINNKYVTEAQFATMNQNIWKRGMHRGE